MTLFGLSPATFALGAAALLAVVMLLHLLRVRLRRVDVDTLLFFQLAGALRQPRVLPGRPARLWSLLLAALAVLAAWSAFAEPHVEATAKSRIVVVEPASGALREARLAAAHELVDHQGLGPRGAVLAAGSSPCVLAAAGEPADAVHLRAAGLPPNGDKADGVRALRAAQDLLQPGDELVWIGGEMPDIAASLPVQALPRGGDAAVLLRTAQWLRSSAGAWLLLDVSGASGRVVLHGNGGELASAALVPAPQQLQLGPIAAGDLLDLRLSIGGQELELPPPPGDALKVHIAADVPLELAAALAALLDVDAELRAVDDVAAADVLVTTADVDDARPCLVLAAGVGGGARMATLEAASPVALSLRDRQPREAAALAVVDGATVWVEDRDTGEPLVQAWRRDGRLRVAVVDWLLAPATHADVPVLLGSALQLLGGRPAMKLAIAGAPLRLPAVIAAAADCAGEQLLPNDGGYSVQFAAAGAETLHTPAGEVRVMVLPAMAAASGAVADDPELETRGGDGSLLPWLAALLLLLVAVDAFLFHRGRLP